MSPVSIYYYWIETAAVAGLGLFGVGLVVVNYRRAQGSEAERGTLGAMTVFALMLLGVAALQIVKGLKRGIWPF